MAAPCSETNTQMASKQLICVEGEGEEKKLKLNDEVLRSLLENDDVRDKPVIVLSVAGAFRTGKSFLLNCMTRYLTAPDKSRWLDNKAESFEWKSGCDAHTNGIWISPPIPVTLESGEEAALLLMDTQGIFDEDSSIADSTRIFALSTLLSSVQVFNVMNNLKSDDLDHLELFAEFGRLATDTMSQKPFQDLVFLVRDWYHTKTHGLGDQGGADLVKKRMGSGKGDVLERRQNIYTCFTSVRGFLLPHPGKVVAGGENFDAADMDREFIEVLEELLSTLLSPESLPAKKHGSNPVSCGQLAELVRTYAEVFNSGKLPEPKSIFQTFADINNMAGVNIGFNSYVEKMKDLLAANAPMLHEELLERRHSEAKSEALDALKRNLIVSDPSKSENHYISLLEDKMAEWFSTMQNVFKEKCTYDRQKAVKENEKLADDCIKLFDKQMVSLIGNRSVGKRQLRDMYEKADQQALQHFKEGKVILGSYRPNMIKERLKRILKEKMQSHFASMEETENMEAVNRQFLLYERRMEDVLADGASMLDARLALENDVKAKTERLEALKSQLTIDYTTKSESDFTCLLVERMEKWFKQSQDRFQKKYRDDELKADTANSTLVNECTKSFDMLISFLESDEHVRETEIRERYQTARQEALQRFENEKVRFGSYTGENSQAELEKIIEERFRVMLARDEDKKNAENALQSQFDYYIKTMLVFSELMFDEIQATDRHVTAVDEAQSALKSKLITSHSTDAVERYCSQLVNNMEKWYQNSREAFKEKCVTNRKKADEANKKLADECLQPFLSSKAELMETKEEEFFKKVADMKNEALSRFHSKSVTNCFYNADETTKYLEDKLNEAESTLKQKRERNSKEKVFKILAACAFTAGAIAAGPVGVATFGIVEGALAASTLGATTVAALPWISGVAAGVATAGVGGATATLTLKKAEGDPEEEDVGVSSHGSEEEKASLLAAAPGSGR